MSTGNRTGMSAAIRDYVWDHPGSSGPAVAEAVGLDRDEVCKALARQARLGIFTRESDGGPYAYTLAREPKVRKLPKDEAAARRKARQKIYGANRRALAVAAKQSARPAIQQPTVAAKPEKPAAHVLPSSFDYEAAGGHVERLPATWEQPQRYGRVGFSGRERMGSPGRS